MTPVTALLGGAMSECVCMSVCVCVCVYECVCMSVYECVCVFPRQQGLLPLSYQTLAALITLTTVAVWI